MQLYVLGILLILYLIFIEPYLRSTSRKKFFSNWKDIKNARVKLYQKDFSRNILIGILTISTAIFGQVSFISDLGFHSPNFHFFLAYPWIIKTIFLAIFLWYFLYYYFFVTVGVRLNQKKFRPYIVKKIKDVEPSAPRTFSEFSWWTLNSFASIFEEIAYRGFIFFFILFLFPNLSIWLVGIISVLTEAIRYAPRFDAMKHVATRGAIFTLSYILFDSIWIPILLHITYNLRIMAVPFHWAREDYAYSKSGN